MHATFAAGETPSSHGGGQCEKICRQKCSAVLQKSAGARGSQDETGGEFLKLAHQSSELVKMLLEKRAKLEAAGVWDMKSVQSWPKLSTLIASCGGILPISIHSIRPVVPTSIRTSFFHVFSTNAREEKICIFHPLCIDIERLYN